MKIQMELLHTLAAVQGEPCVTISLQTHRTHPDNTVDAVTLKNSCHEAAHRLTQQFGKREIEPMLKALEKLPVEWDANHNLDSLHIFLSNKMQQIVKLPWPASNTVYVAENFTIKPLIHALSMSRSYYVLLLSQSGVHMYHAYNDLIEEEVKNGDFPFKESRHYHTDHMKTSDPKLMDDMVREFLNRVDKAVVKEATASALPVVVISTGDNYSRLLQVADRPLIYAGHSDVNYNDISLQTIGRQAWEVMKAQTHEQNKRAVNEAAEAAGAGKLVTDLAEIARAAREGRGELLIADFNYMQPARFAGDDIEITDSAGAPGVMDDITGHIAWQVLSMKGRVCFVNEPPGQPLGKVSLKLRF